MAGAKRWPVPLKGLLSGLFPTQSTAGAATRDDTNPLACIVITAANLPFGGCTPDNAPRHHHPANEHQPRAIIGPTCGPPHDRSLRSVL